MTKSRVMNTKAKKRVETQIGLATVVIGMGLGLLIVRLMFVGA